MQEPALSILKYFSENYEYEDSLLEILFPYDYDYESIENSMFRGCYKQCYIQGDVLTIQEEENTGFIVLNEFRMNEFGLRENESTSKVSFELQLLFEGVCIEIEGENRTPPFRESACRVKPVRSNPQAITATSLPSPAG